LASRLTKTEVVIRKTQIQTNIKVIWHVSLSPVGRNEVSSSAANAQLR
jgi:hypothetical protein